MPEPFWLLILGVAVVIAVALFRRYVLAAKDISALVLTIIACVIAAAIDVFLISHSLLGFFYAALIIYAVANLIFQVITQLQKINKP